MFILLYRYLEIMFGKTGLEKRIQDLEEKQATLMRVMGEIKKEVESLNKALEDMDSKISFLNVLSANLNNMKYGIEMKLADSLSSIRSEIKDMLDSYEADYKQIYADMQVLVQQYRSPGPQQGSGRGGGQDKEGLDVFTAPQSFPGQVSTGPGDGGAGAGSDPQGAGRGKRSKRK